MSGTASQPSERGCIWCGGGPLTAEHAWPQWIAKYLPAEKIDHLALIEHEGKAPRLESRGLRVPFTTKVRCVCKPCNEGWMHELETAAEPVLAPLIQGKEAVWHEWRQTLAATWAFKTAVVLEQTHSDHRAIPPELYPLFRKYQTPPPFSQFWIARYDGTFPHNFGRGVMRLLLTSEGVPIPSDLEAYGAFVQVGALAFRIFGHLIQNGPSNVPQGELARALVPIRPVVPAAEWPPELTVDDDGLELLVKSMGDVAPASPVSPGPESLDG